MLMHLTTREALGRLMRVLHREKVIQPACLYSYQIWSECQMDHDESLSVRAAAGERMSGHTASSMITVGPDAEEYDPARPNDYNDVRDARQAQRKEAELEAVRQERLKAQQTVSATSWPPSKSDEYTISTLRALIIAALQDEGSMFASSQHSLNASTQLSLSGEEAYARRARFVLHSQQFPCTEECMYLLPVALSQALFMPS